MADREHRAAGLVSPYEKESKNSPDQNASGTKVHPEQRKVSDDVVKKFVDLLKKESWRRHIHFRDCKIPKSALKILRNGMIQHELTAGVLDLSGSSFDELNGSWNYVGEIVNAARIKRLILQQTSITPQSVQELTEGILECRANKHCELKYLDLRGNSNIETKEGGEQINKLMVVTSVNVIKLNAFTIQQNSEERTLMFSAGMGFIEWGEFLEMVRACQVERFIIEQMPFTQKDAELFVNYVLSTGLCRVNKVTIHLESADTSTYKFGVEVIVVLNVKDVLLCNAKERSQTDIALRELKRQLGEKINQQFNFGLRTALFGMTKESWELVVDIITICKARTLEMTFEPGNMSFTEVFKKYKHKVSTLTIKDDGYDNFESVLVIAWQVLPFVSRELVFQNFCVTMDQNLLMQMIQKFYGNQYTVKVCDGSLIKIRRKSNPPVRTLVSLPEHKTEDLIDFSQECVQIISSRTISESAVSSESRQKEIDGDEWITKPKRQQLPPPEQWDTGVGWSSIQEESSMFSADIYSADLAKSRRPRRAFEDINACVSKLPSSSYSTETSTSNQSCKDGYQDVFRMTCYSTEKSDSGRPCSEYGETFKSSKSSSLFSGTCIDFKVLQKTTRKYMKVAQHFNTIDVSNTELEQKDILKLVGVIPFCKNLQSIILKDCKLNGNNAAEVMQALGKMQNKVITLLDFSSNPDMGELGSKAIADLIEKRHIENIKVIGCGLEIWHEDVVSPSMARTPMQAGKKVGIEYSENKVDFTLRQQGGSVNMASYGCGISFQPKCHFNEATELSFVVKSPDRSVGNGRIPVSPLLRCLPSRSTFSKSFTIRLPTWVNPKGRHENSVKLNLQVLTRESEEDRWTRMVHNIRHGMSSFVEFESDHFSDFQVVMNIDQAAQAEANYCNMLFVPQYNPLQHSSQTLHSWIIPNNAAVIEDKKRQNLQNGMKLYDGGEMPLRIMEADQFTVNVSRFEEENPEPISILPPQPIQFSGANVIQELYYRKSFVVRLMQQNDPDEQKTADLCHRVTKNACVIIEDPLTMRWRPRQEAPEIAQHVFYNIYNIHNAAVAIDAGGGQDPEVIQQLVEAMVPPHEDVPEHQEADDNEQ